MLWINHKISVKFQLLEANELNDDVQTIEMSQVSTDEMQMLLEVVYNGVVEATIEDLRKLILLAHRLYIAIPLSNELMQGSMETILEFYSVSYNIQQIFTFVWT